MSDMPGMKDVCCLHTLPHLYGTYQYFHSIEQLGAFTTRTALTNSEMQLLKCKFLLDSETYLYTVVPRKPVNIF